MEDVLKSTVISLGSKRSNRVLCHFQSSKSITQLCPNCRKTEKTGMASLKCGQRLGGREYCCDSAHQLGNVELTVLSDLSASGSNIRAGGN